MMEYKKIARLSRYIAKYASKKKLKRTIERYPDYRIQLNNIYDELSEAGKNYIEFIAKWYVMAAKNGKGWLLPKFIDAAEGFDEVKQYLENKDILSYTDLEDLQVAIDEGRYKKGLKEDKDKRINLYKGDKFRVDIPETHGSTCILGKDTKWCITQSSPGYYDTYSKDNYIFIITNPKAERDDRYGKIAVLLNKTTGKISEIRDRFDIGVPVERLMRVWGDAYSDIVASMHQIAPSKLEPEKTDDVEWNTGSTDDGVRFNVKSSSLHNSKLNDKLKRILSSLGINEEIEGNIEGQIDSSIIPAGKHDVVRIYEVSWTIRLHKGFKELVSLTGSSKWAGPKVNIKDNNLKLYWIEKWKGSPNKIKHNWDVPMMDKNELWSYIESKALSKVYSYIKNNPEEIKIESPTLEEIEMQIGNIPNTLVPDAGKYLPVEPKDDYTNYIGEKEKIDNFPLNIKLRGGDE